MKDVKQGILLLCVCLFFILGMKVNVKDTPEHASLYFENIQLKLLTLTLKHTNDSLYNILSDREMLDKELVEWIYMRKQQYIYNRGKFNRFKHHYGLYKQEHGSRK